MRKLTVKVNTVESWKESEFQAVSIFGENARNNVKIQKQTQTRANERKDTNANKREREDAESNWIEKRMHDMPALPVARSCSFLCILIVDAVQG